MTFLYSAYSSKNKKKYDIKAMIGNTLQAAMLISALGALCLVGGLQNGVM